MLTYLRLIGLAGSLMLATAGWLGGAVPDADLTSTPMSIARGPYGPAILGLWVIGTGLQAWAWWSARDRVPSTRWAVITALLWMAPFLFTPPMGSRDFYSYACQGEMFLHGIDPYLHGVDALPCSWLETVSTIWRDTPTPYGPLFILIAAAAVKLTGGLTGSLIIFRLVTLAGLAAIAVGLPALARACGIPAERAVWLALAGPLVGAHMLAAPHNDAVMLGFAVLALFLLVRVGSQPWVLVTSGALLGLAVAVKATAGVLIPFAVLMTGLAFVRSTLLIGTGALLSFGTVTLASGLGLGWIPAMRVGDSLIQFTSLPTAVGMTLTYTGRLFSPTFDAVPAVRNVALVLLISTLVFLWFRAFRASPENRRKAALHNAALSLAAFVALVPVFHAWYILWPLTLLAATTLRTRLAMLLTIAAAYLVLPDGGGLSRFVKFPGAPLVVLALIALLIVETRRRRRNPAEPTPVPG
ncbi:polyprenol phosphomannose-dependent alpha 1,6 mannosyltransferase MptB [Actinoplanes couchii]|uniref:polyprenol phosphomannose-dependent alpha 1,6 mannosyltransferase MptB n=1 Tax=Actinoplanes couchii TaxID=403638 RepID=UPI001EF2D703|nr:polyprenol phosphomannose-dependent alpha 1,6 mannosyltransferase MptB [Actinoplanes couchii]MDR6317819.1 alpha-1,6-mannosyltransferase [Actinoplanes couchii]